MPRGFASAALLLLAIAALFAATPLDARVVPADEHGRAAPDVQVIDEGGNRAALNSLLAAMGTGPVLILPVYTHCAISCPIQSQKLKQGLAEMNQRPLRVILFSFDPQETSESLAQFRKVQALPSNWKLVRASETAAAGYFDFFHYPILTGSGEFVHPDRIFVLDASLRWQASIEGLNWDLQELRQVVGEAGSPGLMLWLRNHVNLVAWIGFANIAVSIGLLFAFLAYSRKSHLSGAN